MPFAIVSVTNDLTTDQRVDRTCMALVKSGYDVLLVGRRLRNSKTLANRTYQMHRMRLLFDKGPLFYAEYNIALFFFLIIHRYDLNVSNDLDTLPASYLANRIKNGFSRNRNLKSEIRFLHDCHEYFRGVPELNGRKAVTRVWKWIEDRFFPKLKHVIAVNQSVADLYAKEYGNPVTVIRNVPFRKPLTGARDKTSMQIRDEQKVILYQGALNVDRGLEEAILAMKYLKTNGVLVLAGIGDIYENLKKLTSENGLSEKVRFLGQVPFQDLHAITLIADLGLSIEKDVSINYRYCLPNKFLDYIQANIPVLVSPFPEMKALVDQYRIGEFIESHDPVILATQFDAMLNNPEKTAFYRQNLLKAAEDLCWEMEEGKIIEIVTRDG
ncbi:MAG: glycosyltransferase [Bacteroidetes bacterium]|nr:glycosyltransferase [Bacteroidota bacterium]